MFSINKKCGPILFLTAVCVTASTWAEFDYVDETIRDGEVPYETIPLITPNDRIGWCADGNNNDPDDWAATPVALATIVAAGCRDQLVHFSFNNRLDRYDREKKAESDESSLGGAQHFGFDTNLFYDLWASDIITTETPALADRPGHAAAGVYPGYDAGFEAAVQEVLASSPSNRFFWIQAGPFEFPYRVLQEAVVNRGATAENLHNTVLVSHSGVNERPGKWSEEDAISGLPREAAGATMCVEDFGVGFFFTGAQYGDRFGGKTVREAWADVAWMTNSTQQADQWMHSRFERMSEFYQAEQPENEGRDGLDASDGGMAYTLLVGNYDGNFAAFSAFISNCTWNATGTAPSVSWTDPDQQAIVVAETQLSLKADASDAGGSVQQVELYRDGVLVATASSRGPSGFFEFPDVALNTSAATTVFTLRALNDAGLSSKLTPLEVTRSGEIEREEAVLIQHLDASVPELVTGSPVTLWTDLSGSNHHAMASAGEVLYPATSVSRSGESGLNMGVGRNSLELFSAEASASWLDQSSGHGGFCVMVAFKCDTLLTNNWNDVIGNSSAITSGFGLRYSASGTMQAYLNGETTDGSEPVAAGDTIVYAFNYNATSNAYTFWDSKSGSSKLVTATAGNFTTANPVTVGSMNFAGRYMKGMIGEILIYHGELSASEQATETTRLMDKWIGEIIPRQSFSEWSTHYSLNGATADLTADPDQDGYNNLLEFALGGNPADPTDGARIAPSHQLISEAGASYIEYAFRRDINRASNNLSYQIEHTPSLTNTIWTPYIGDLAVEEIIGEADFQRVTAKIDITEGHALFARLIVSMTNENPTVAGAFIEENGLIVIEAESIDLPSDWEFQNHIAGYMGDGFIVYTGAGRMDDPGDVILSYPIRITKPGTYEFAWHCRNGETAVEGDKENDSWLKIVADRYFRILQGNEMNNNDIFWKVHLSSLGEWNWLGENPRVNGADSSGLRMFATFDAPGTYEVQITGRSRGHIIDRLVLWHSDVDAAVATDPDAPLSRREGE